MELNLTPRELDIMAVLWRRGSATVAEVRDAFPNDLAYTTILSVLRTLEGKGFVRHVTVGKAHRFVPIVAQDAAGRHILGQVLDKVFQGSAEMLLTQLVTDRRVDKKKLRRLRDMLDERLGEGGTAK